MTLLVSQLTHDSKTYGEHEGEDIREGFEPTDSADVVDPKVDDHHDFVIEDDESPGAEESRQWQEVPSPAVRIPPKYGIEGEDLENVWGGASPKEPPKENP